MSRQVRLAGRHRSWATTMIGVAALVVLAQEVALARPQDDPGALQKQGIERVNQYIDRFRRTGDRSALLPQLQQAGRELRESYNGFTATRDLAAAALSVITLGDIERMQDHWNPSRALYSRAQTLAVQAHHPGYQARALTGLARTELSGGGNLSAAIDRLTDAIRLATAAGNKDYLFDALDFAAQVESGRGDLAAASAYLDRCLALRGEVDDKAKPLYGYLDRADVYLKRAEKCDYERNFDACYSALNLARADYEQALRRAQELGFSFLAQETRDFLREVDQRQALAYFKRGYSRSAVGDRDGAIADYTASLQLDPRDGDVYNNRGVKREENGEVDDALADYTRAIELDSANRHAWFNRGRLRQGKGDLAGAIADLTRAVQLNPRDSAAYFERGYAREVQGDREGAIEDYSRAIAVAPGYAYAYNNRGNLRRFLAQSRADAVSKSQGLKDALADFARAIGVDRKYALAYRNRGVVRADLGEYAAAIKDYTTAVRLDPGDPTAHLYRARARQALDDWDGAIADFTAVIGADPTFTSVYVERTVARGAKGDLDGAVADGDTAIAKEPHDPFGYEARSYVRLALRDGTGAHADALQTLRMRASGDSHFSYGVIVGYLGLRRAGQAADAAAFLSTWAPRADSSGWPYPVIQYFQRRLSAPTLLTRAKSDSETTEARTYLALDLLLSEQVPVALPHLQWVRDHGIRTYFEYPVALAELRRISGGARRQ